MKLNGVVASVALGWALSASADQFHYNNIVPGDRAQGLGGAFTAIADDASGVIYNPAGISFAIANDISGSANAFYQRKVTYKEAAFKKDFVENSQGTLAPFVGGLGKLDNYVPGLVFAFGIYSPDSELQDQDDLIKPDNQTRFHRTANKRANTTTIAAAFGKRFGSSFAIGFSLGYVMIDELAQIYQDSTSVRQGYVVDENGKRTAGTDGKVEARKDCCFRNLTQNVREYLRVQAIEPAIGFQWAIGGQFSLGAMIRQPFIVSEKYETSFEQTITYSDGSGKVMDVSETGIYDLPTERTSMVASDNYRLFNDGENEKSPMKSFPMQIRLGGAWFASPRLLMAFDVIHYTEAKSGLDNFDREPVTNVALGGEYYLTPSWPIRMGVFTNNDARPKPDSNKINQPDSIDYTGGSLFLAFVQPNSQISAGVTHQIGSGKAQKLAGSTSIQDVEASSTTLGFSVSHNF